MKNILTATLQPTGTTDMEGNYCEWNWAESSIAEHGHEWNGDIKGYIENLIEDDGNYEILAKSESNFTIHNFNDSGYLLMIGGVPSEIYWTEE